MGALGADEACQCLAEVGEQGASCCQPTASSAGFKGVGIESGSMLLIQRVE